jgi:ATP phosphoribosyltransferase regulatory subunit
MNQNVNIFLDLCEIDDKNYHSGIRFTFFAKNVRGEIARGGRYFVKNSKQNNEATGFTCYMDSILRASSTTIKQKKIMVPFDTSKTKIKALITKDFIVIRHFSNLKDIKQIAKDKNFKFYLENNIVKSLS